jgi:hypothetical protein
VSRWPEAKALLSVLVSIMVSIYQYECNAKESGCLLGDEIVELFFRNDSILVSVSSFDHLLKNVIVCELSEVLSHLTEVLKGNEACFLWVEGNEDLVDLVSALVVGRSGSHHVKELVELNLSAAVLIEFGNHLIDSLRLCLDSEGVDSDFEFCVVYVLPLGSMAPPRSRSNRSKAFLISSTSS